MHPLHGGGDIAIEATRGLTAIDVDSGGRAGSGDAEAFALDLNLAAADEAARQVALRGLGGLVAIDFVGMLAAKNRRDVAEAFRKSLAARLGRASEVLELSQLGVCEAAIARRIRPVRDALAAPAAEREALDVLRAIESAGWAARGARLHARVSQQAAEWLEVDPVGWKDQLAGRIGARWTIEGGAPGKAEVWSA